MVTQMMDDWWTPITAQSLWSSQMGVEVETQRIDQQGHLSQQPYPNSLGSRSTHPYLQTDFGETQTEWISDPQSDNRRLIEQLTALRSTFLHHVSTTDRLWLLSMPPALSNEDRQFVRDHFGRPQYQRYRDYLDGKFGIAHGLVTGVHLNFSLPQSLLLELAEEKKRPVSAIQNQVYWRVVQNFLKARWLLTYFFGGSPIAEAGYFPSQPTALAQPVRSIRNSRFGFNNGGRIKVPYTSLSQHVQALTKAVETGDLYAPMEFYGPIRIKGQEHLADFLTKGIQYLELRTFDTNPFFALGVAPQQLDFIRAMLAYFTVTPVDQASIGATLTEAATLNDQVALQSPTKSLPQAAVANQFLDMVINRLLKLGAPAALLAAVRYYQQQLRRPEVTLAAQLTAGIEQDSLATLMLRLAEQYQQKFVTDPAILAGTSLSPANQALLRVAIQRGIRFKEPLVNQDGLTLIVNGRPHQLHGRTTDLVAIDHQLASLN